MTTKHNSGNDPVHSFQRRNFLKSVAAAVPAVSLASVYAQDPPAPAARQSHPYPGVIMRQKNPFNAEFPFATLDKFHSPNDTFFIRSHFNVPEIDAGQWKLSVEGHVERPFEIGLEEFRKLGSTKLTALLECAGNSRIFLQPQPKGLRWEQGGVGNAEWTGVPLAKVLERAGVKAGAVEIILEGMDKGKVDDDPKTPGEIHFARSLPLAKAMRPEVILAHTMNGEPLTADHGYPLRAVVAGWYGMASIKWLRRIIVTPQPYHGYYQTFSYTIWQRQDPLPPTLVPVTDIRVKSQIARPMLHEVVPAGSNYRIHGAAWSGALKIAKVDISVDGGKGWAAATLDEQSVPFAWRFFHFDWKVPEKEGTYTLMSRATNDKDDVQPMQRDPDLRDAIITHVQPIQVVVRKGRA